jgi:hypothetical protein
MENTSPKFGGWRLCATCGRESEVKATENKKWMVDRKKKKKGKKGVEKKMKKLVTMVRGGIDRSTLSRRL